MSQYSLPVIGLSGILLAAQAGALELGGIRVLSEKDEPFKADIELSDVGTLRPIDIAVSLASEAEFKQVRLQRPGFLMDLQYDIILNGKDGGVIHVSSPVPVPDDEWDLLLETRWPNGRELKQFVVDTDKRYFANDGERFAIDESSGSQAAIAPVTNDVIEADSLEDIVTTTPEPEPEAPPAPVAIVESATVADPEPEPEPELNDAELEANADSDPVISEPSAEQVNQASWSEQPWSAEDTYTTVRGDVLWRIARRVRPADDVSIYQTLLALQQLNENAFVRNNVNRLKVGQVLRIPNEAQVRANELSVARREIGDQIREWEAETGAARQIDARSSADSSFTPSVSDTPSLSLSTDSGDGINTAVDDNQRVEELTRQLEDALAQLQKAQQMTATLSEEVAEKNRLITDLQNKLKLLNAQMAELQARLGDEAEDTETVDSSTDAIETPEWSAEAEDPDSEFENVVEESVEQAVVDPKPQTVEPQKTWKDQLLSWPGAAAILALLSILGLFWVARRRKDAEELRAFEEEFDLPEERQPGYAAPADVTTDAEDFGDNDQRVAEQEAAEYDEGETFDDAEEDSSDPLKEADIYLAYGRFPEAADMLEQALSEEPDREDYLEKLVQVHAAAGDEQAEQAAIERLASIRGSDLFDDELLELEEADEHDMRIAASELDELELDLDDGLDDLGDDLDELGDDFKTVADEISSPEFDSNVEQLSSLTPFESERQNFELDEVQPSVVSDDIEGFPAIESLDTVDSVNIDDVEALQDLEDLSDFDEVPADEDLLDLQDDAAPAFNVSEEHEVSLHSARQLIEHGDQLNARHVLEQLVSTGTALEKQQARELLLQLD